jgi:hypothetical protein
MRTSILTLLLAAALTPAVAGAQTQEADAPQYVAGSQYTAELNQTTGHWHLLPANGQDVEIDTGTCATGAVHPKGLWLLVRDANGRPELLAPSTTPLPVGSPDRIAIRSCDQATGNELAVPQVVIDLLTADTGAVLLND